MAPPLAEFKALFPMKTLSVIVLLYGTYIAPPPSVAVLFINVIFLIILIGSLLPRL